MRMPCFSVRRRLKTKENNIRQQQQQYQHQQHQQQQRQDKTQQDETQQLIHSNKAENFLKQKRNYNHSQCHDQYNQQMTQDWSFDDYDQNPKHTFVQLSSMKQIPTQQKKNKMLLQSRKRLLHQDKVVGTALEQTVSCQIGSFWKLELNFWTILTCIALIVFIILAFTTGARLNKLEKQLKGVQKLFLMQKMGN